MDNISEPPTDYPDKELPPNGDAVQQMGAVVEQSIHVEQVQNKSNDVADDYDVSSA